MPYIDLSLTCQSLLTDKWSEAANVLVTKIFITKKTHSKTTFENTVTMEMPIIVSESFLYLSVLFHQ